MKDPLDLLHVHPAADGSDESDASINLGAQDGHESSVSAEGGALVLRGDQSPADRLSLLVSWSGHTDAGSLSEQLSESLLGALPHRRLASFDVDELFDYRSRRPQITFTDNRFSNFEAPSLELYEVRDALGRPFLFLTGDEPDYQWERVSSAVLQLVDRLDVKLVVLVDALGLPTPHTRPIGVTAHGNRQDLIEGISTWGPSAQIEAGLSQFLELRVAEADRDVVGYTLHVPHYLAGGRFPHVAVSALEYAGAALELMLPTDELRESSRMVEQDITRQVAQNSEIQGMVDRLERNFDEYATPQQRSLLVKDDDAVPDAEELGAAVEAYLRHHDPAADAEAARTGAIQDLLGDALKDPAGESDPADPDPAAAPGSEPEATAPEGEVHDGPEDAPTDVPRSQEHPESDPEGHDRPE
ncbi:PAC2 family protein [Nesterenkonia sandarakina]|uniref:PAC2 family protein n=1 Tax=Nesterenkonia sandarakina TaxID=272918 RepID=A0A2T0YSJ3_9MICC|nr:PAC2 family protein [Nesterenkonia sandarakina]PRZ18742.1 PAC2 family protein [Nesterenkonia sandarakina]